MKYKLNSATAKNLPYTNKDGIYGIDVFIKTGIVDQTYLGFENLSLGFCPIEKTDDTNMIENKINIFAIDYVSKKYPNT
jgi:hypothetical protein